MDNGVLGNAIRQARIDNNISQEKLAELVNITPTHLKHIESEHRKPSVEVLFHLMEVLHLSVDNLIFEQSDNYSQLHDCEILLKQCNQNEISLLIGIIKLLLKNREIN